MYEKVVKERIAKIISAIQEEKKIRTDPRFDEGFDCGTQMGLDLLGEWKEELK